MRTLLILRGCPGAGKSTWVRENHLEAYTLCPDDIRVLCASRDLQADGRFAIARNHNVEQMTWKVIFELLEYRMSRGEFTVLDATASKTKDIKQYKDLADKYRYRMFCVDFTGVPIEVCKERNLLRPEDKIVPESGIDNIYARFATQPVPSGIEVIKPDELYKALEEPIVLSSYKKIVMVGDIHGCFDTLMQYPDFKNGLQKDVEYIFLGDYIDRGNQNAEVMNWLYSIKDEPNVCLLEGNHEKWLRFYGEGEEAKSREFEEKTKKQLIDGGFTPKMARVFYRKLRQMSHFEYGPFDVLASHGGISNRRVNLAYIPTCHFINGVGEYNDYQIVADTWMRETAGNQYQVHGHRNTAQDPAQLADRVFNLEGEVEFGGKLRIVELSRSDDADVAAPVWKVVELENCQPITEEADLEKAPVTTVEQAVAYLRNNRFVREKQLENGVSSFNFTREAFYSANWNRQTVLARGLFIDTENNKIMARSYEKFFRINETKETDLLALKGKLRFPVKAYVKENGFLGIVSYDYNKDDLFIASKSTTEGDYAEYFKALLEPYRERILNLYRRVRILNAAEQNKYWFASDVKMDPVSLVFEVIDKDNDPHIIKYGESKIVLLDVIRNELTFEALPYDSTKKAAEAIGCPVKELAYTIKDWDEFKDLYTRAQDEDYKYNGNYIEGFVFVDQKGFMTKLKTGYYNFWKHMRSVADSMLRKGMYWHMGSIDTAAGNMFAAFCKECYNKDRDKETDSYPYKTDIISMREKFYGRAK